MVECHDRFAISCRVGNHSITLCQEASEFGQGRVDGIDGRDIFRESVEIILSRAIGPVCLHSIASDRAFSVAPDCHGIQLSDSSGNADRFESGSLRSKVVGWRSVDSHLRILPWVEPAMDPSRSEEHTSELQSLMRISYAVFCLKK